MRPLPSLSAPSFAHAHVDAFKRLASCGTCLVTLVLAACGGGGGGGAPATTGSTPQSQDLAAGNYLPLQVGNRWFYQSSDSSTPVTVRLTATATVDGLSGTVEHSDDPGDTSSSILVADAQGVRQFPAADADALTAAVGPVQLLRYPLRVGDTFVASDKSVGAVEDIDGDGIADAATVHADTKVVAVEQVTTPAGTFADCIHLQTTATVVVQSSALKQSITISNVEDDWLAPGIGPVRTVSVTTGNGTSASTTQSITAYGVGAKRSESVAPTATAPGLTGTAPLGPQTLIDVLFSEDMDLLTLAGSFHLLDAAGQPVSGNVTASTRSLHFAPSAALASGSYTARLDAGATDLVGNPVAGTAAWTFLVDAVPPSVVQSQPLQGTVDVAVASSVVVTFSEPVDPATVGPRTLPLMTGDTNAAADYQVAGAVVTITPLVLLARGTDYRVVVQGVTDLTGNPAYGTTASFRTDPGRFDFGRSLVPVGTSQYTAPVGAVGDLDGDGRPDVVTSSIVNVGPALQDIEILAYLQQPDGTLSAGMPVATLPSDCGVAGIAIGDIDGDGRNELLVARPGTCHSLVYRRSSDGTYSQDATAAPPLHDILLADLDRDGRTEVISSGDADEQLRVWSATGGAWVVRSAITVNAGRPVVGDLNGDGLPDIAFSANFVAYAAPQTAGVIYQTAGGGFSSPQLLHTASDGFFPQGSVSIADIDGDGRNDLVVGTQYSISVFKQDATGHLGAEEILQSDYAPFPAAAADLNGDGRVDLVYALDSTDLKVRLQQADGSFGAPAAYSPAGLQFPVNVVASLVVADVNGDGRPDILLNGKLYLQRPVPATSDAVRGRHPSGTLATRLRQLMRTTKAAHPM